MTKKMCRIIGSRRNIVVVGTNSERVSLFTLFAKDTLRTERTSDFATDGFGWAL
jgi:hypothetical protein